MPPWILQGLAIGCLLTAAAAVVLKEAAKVAPTEPSVSGGAHFERPSGSPGKSNPNKLPTKIRGLHEGESYASHMQRRIREGGFVTVGGQVNSPGPLNMGTASTLHSVIEKAGGATAFAALSRVRLTRGPVCTEYNLTTEEGRQVLVLAKDTIEVPQKMTYGR